MLFRRKKCIFYAQVRQLVMHYTCTTQAKTKPVYDCSKFKYSYLTNASLNVRRLFNNRPESEVHMPSLMKIYIPPKYFSVLYFIKTLYTIHAIDRNFNIFDFMRGTSQAITVISNALALRNYEMLDGLVTERAIKVLKHRVDRLTPYQRDLLNLAEDTYNFYPFVIVLHRTKGTDEAIIKVGLRGHTMKTHSSSDSDIITPIYFKYIFQRKYINNIGGAWMVRFIDYSAGYSNNFAKF